MRVEIKKLKARDHILVFDEENRIQHIEQLSNKKLLNKGKNFVIEKLMQFNAVKEYLKSNGHSEEEATKITSDYAIKKFKTIIERIPSSKENYSEDVNEKEIIQSFFNIPLFSDA